MAQTHDVGRLFVHGLVYPSRQGVPLTEKGTTHEIEEPFRKGSSRVVRVPFTRRAVVLGWWHDPLPEEVAILGAIAGREMDASAYEVSTWD